MTQVINWSGDSGDGVYISGGDPKDTNHTPLRAMNFQISSKLAKASQADFTIKGIGLTNESATSDNNQFNFDISQIDEKVKNINYSKIDSIINSEGVRIDTALVSQGGSFSNLEEDVNERNEALLSIVQRGASGADKGWPICPAVGLATGIAAGSIATASGGGADRKSVV